MVDKAPAVLRPPLVQGLFESVQDKAGVRRAAGRQPVMRRA